MSDQSGTPYSRGPSTIDSTRDTESDVRHDTGMPGSTAGTTGGTTGTAGGTGGTASTVVHSSAQQAADVASSAAENAKQVASEASDQVKLVADQAKQHVETLVGQARTELHDHAQNRATQAATGLRSLSTQLEALAAGRVTEAGPLVGYVDDARQRAERLASRLETRGAQGLMQDTTRFARRRPGAFLLCSLGAGVLAGRLLRAGRAAPMQQSGTQQGLQGLQQGRPMHGRQDYVAGISGPGVESDRSGYGGGADQRVIEQTTFPVSGPGIGDQPDLAPGWS